MGNLVKTELPAKQMGAFHMSDLEQHGLLTKQWLHFTWAIMYIMHC